MPRGLGIPPRARPRREQLPEARPTSGHEASFAGWLRALDPSVATPRSEGLGPRDRSARTWSDNRSRTLAGAEGPHPASHRGDKVRASAGGDSRGKPGPTGGWRTLPEPRALALGRRCRFLWTGPGGSVGRPPPHIVRFRDPPSKERLLRVSPSTLLSPLCLECPEPCPLRGCLPTSLPCLGQLVLFRCWAERGREQGLGHGWETSNPLRRSLVLRSWAVSGS